MQRFLQIIKWGGIPVGFAVSVAGIAATARDIATWGLPVWLWYLIGLVVFSASASLVIAGFWRESKSIKQELEKAKRDANPIVRGERRELRTRFKDRLQIPNILFQMFERSRQLTEDANRNHRLGDEELERLGKKLFAAGYLAPDSQFIKGATYLAQFENPFDIVANPSTLKVLKSFNVEMEKFLFSMQGIMQDENIGAMALSTSDPTCQQLLSRIRKLQIGLPDKINMKIIEHHIISNSMANLSYFDVKTTVSPGVAAILPFLKEGTSVYVRGLNSEISNLIEKFLAGEDIK